MKMEHIEELIDEVIDAAKELMTRPSARNRVQLWNARGELQTEFSRLLAALAEIEKGEGAYSRDPLEHASNTIDYMKRIAREAREATK